MFDTGLWDSSRFDVQTHAAGDSTTLTDTLAKRPQPRAADTQALADAIAKQARLRIDEAASLSSNLSKAIAAALANENITLADSLAPRVMYLFEDGVALTDSILNLTRAIRGDTQGITDGIRSRPRKQLEDLLALESAAIPGTIKPGDILTKSIKPLFNEVISATDAVTRAVAAYLEDTIALADSLALATRRSVADTLSLVDGIANLLRKGGLDDAVGLADAFLRRYGTNIGDEQTALADALAGFIRRGTENDPAALAEALVFKVAILLDDLTAAADTIRAKASGVNDETAGATDSLSVTLRKTLADTVGLADSLARRYQTAVPTIGAFDFGAFDISQYDGVQTEGVGVSDALSIAQRLGVMGQDLVNIADAIRATMKSTLDDALGLSDSHRARPRSRIDDLLALESVAVPGAIKPADILQVNVYKSLSDLAGLTDSVLKSTAGLLSDSTGASDAIALLAKLLAADGAGANDAYMAKNNRLLAEILSLSDASQLAVYKLAEETTATAEAVAKLIRGRHEEALSLSESLALYTAIKGLGSTLQLVDDIARLSKLTAGAAFDAAPWDSSIWDSTGDMAALDDVIRAAVAVQLADAVGLSDDLRKRTARTIEDLGSLSDDLAAAVAARAGDIVTLSDTLGKAVTRTLEAVIAVADDLEKKYSTTVTDALPLEDSSSLTAGSRHNDGAALVDALANRGDYKLSLDDLAALEDIIAKSAYQVAANAVLLTDALQKTAKLDKESAAALAEAVAIRVALGLNEQAVALADTVTTMLAMFIQHNVNSSTGLSADINRLIRFIMGASYDTASFDSSAFDEIGERIAAGDEAVITAKPTAFELIALLEDSNLRARPGHDEQGSVADELTAKVGRQLVDTISLSDSAALGLGKQLADTAALADFLATKAGLPLADVVPVADLLAVNAKLATITDAVGFVDAVSRMIRRSVGASFDGSEWDYPRWDDTGDTVEAKDEMRLFISAVVEDLLALESAAIPGAINPGDYISATVKKREEDSTTLADLIRLGAIKAAASTTGISDELLQLLIRTQLADLSSLEDLLNKKAGLPPSDAQAVSDSIIASLKLVMQAEDLLAALDAATAKFTKWLDEQLPFLDSYYFDVKKAIAEAVSVAELIGKNTKRPVSENGIGMIDEARLRAALGLPTDEVILGLDQIQGVVKTLLQQVFIEGVSVPVTGLSVRHSTSNRVSTCRFRIPSPTPEVLALAKQRAEVKVYLVDGNGNTDYFAGRIAGNPTRARGSISTEMEITVDDWTAAAADVYVTEVLDKDFGTLDYVIKYLWQKYYGMSVDLSQVVTTDKRADLLTFNYTSLFEATERIAQLLGWVWFIEWDGAQRILRFYPPTAAVVPVTLSRENRNVAAGTARFGFDNQIVNSLYVFGGEGISGLHTERSVADGEAITYKLNHKIYKDPNLPAGGVTVRINGVTKKVGVLNVDDLVDFDVLVDFNQSTLHWEEWNRPAKDAVIERTYKYLYPIMVHLTDSTSIKEYGKIERTITDTKLRTAAAARDFGRAYLRDYALPKGFGSCEVYVPGLRAGQFVTVDMPAYNARGLYEITEVEKWIQGSVLKRRVNLNVADDPESRIAQRLKDFARRLESLEANGRPEDLVIQKIVNGVENIAVTAAATARGFIQDQVNSKPDLRKDELQASLFVAGAPKVYRFEKALTNDSTALRIRPRKEEAVPAVDKIGGGITFFDKHTFGDTAHPFGM